MSKKFLTHIDLSKNELQNAVIQPLASAPSAPNEGQVYYNTTDDTVYVWANGAWLDLGVQGGSGAVDSVNGQTGVVVLDPDDLDDTATTNKFTTAGDISKLAGIETGADVTDATNVAAAGAVMESDTSTASMSFVIDEDNMASNSATKVPTQQSVKAYADSLLGAADAITFKGVVDASTNPNYPAAVTGDFYKISVAGKIGGASGIDVQVGDAILATADNAGGTQAAVGTSWTVLQSNVDQATDATLGLVELATLAETEARTDTVRAVTPSGLASFPRKYAEDVGDNSSTQIDVTHSLGTKDVTVTVRQNSDDVHVECDITSLSTSVVRLNFTVAPATDALRAVVTG